MFIGLIAAIKKGQLKLPFFIKKTILVFDFFAHKRSHNQNSINIPELLEFTFLRNDRVELNDEKLQFPHALDEQCAPHRPPRHLPKCWWS